MGSDQARNMAVATKIFLVVLIDINNYFHVTVVTNILIDIFFWFYQEEIYKDVAEPLLKKTLEGYNVSAVMFGQVR